MPIYDFDCPACGVFETLLPSAERNTPRNCPDCGHAMQRLVCAPRLQILNTQQRTAHETNERSAHAPKVSHGHSCCSSGSCSHTPRADGQPPALKQQTGPRRPWMISH
ncbi:zinc ribbon domain-containing protein [Pseudomonas saliphila]|uniref:zinc ribbon domain-containing protein n=1 Tax=Pseudomonas saliphila TaxID=2586906 RepID=UPI001239A11F|nr:zinc ribbon domain-containing protein [Pseudomonas saliphila]